MKPSDLKRPHVFDHTNDEMFLWVTHGVDNPEGGLAMRRFASTLSAEDRWALIDYVRACSAGVAMQQDSSLNQLVRASAMPIKCSGMAASLRAVQRSDSASRWHSRSDLLAAIRGIRTPPSRATQPGLP
jgi:hypothetical protein